MDGRPMTRKQDEQNAPSGAERVTRRGLGLSPDPRGVTATGEFPLSWPELPESPTPPGAETVERDTARDSDAGRDRDAARDSEEVTSSWQRPQSRGPEYHPPSLPAQSRVPPPSRMPPPRANSGTFRVGTPPAAQSRPT